MTELEKQYKEETGNIIAISVAKHPFVEWLGEKYAEAKAGQHENRCYTLKTIKLWKKN